MVNEQARKIFDQAIAAARDADQVARIEIAREYFLNAGFRKALEDHVWTLNGGGR